MEVETENAAFWNTMDIKLKFKGDNLTGFSNMFRLNVCLLTLHVHSDPFFKKRDMMISDIKFKAPGDAQSTGDPNKMIEVNSLKDKRFTNLNEFTNLKNQFEPENQILKWGLEELDQPVNSLPRDFELEFEFEVETTQAKVCKLWETEFRKIEKLRQDVVILMSKDNKDGSLGKVMLFGDVELMDIKGLNDREF